MKRLELTPVEVRTLRDMGIFHSHPRTRMRAQAIVRLSQGLTLQQVANEFAVHLNSVEHWRQRWNKDGLTGLYEGHHSGRPPKWNEAQQQALRDLANQQGGTAGALLRRIGQTGQQPPVSVYTIKRYLKNAQMRCKRCRYSLKSTALKVDGSVLRIFGMPKEPFALSSRAAAYRRVGRATDPSIRPRCGLLRNGFAVCSQFSARFSIIFKAVQPPGQRVCRVVNPASMLRN